MCYINSGMFVSILTLYAHSNKLKLILKTEYIMKTIYDFGEYGPIILIFLSWYLLWDNKKLFVYYTIGIFINAILNIILKGIIQEPRPLFDAEKVKLATTHAKTFFYQNGIPFNIFGMPSGHAQTSFFTTIFISIKNV